MTGYRASFEIFFRGLPKGRRVDASKVLARINDEFTGRLALPEAQIYWTPGVVSFWIEGTFPTRKAVDDQVKIYQRMPGPRRTVVLGRVTKTGDTK